MLQTLGDVITCAVVVVAVVVVPMAIARAWWPEVRRALTNAGGALIDMFVMSNGRPASALRGPVDTPDRQLVTAASHPIAITSTAVNDEVTVNPVDAGAADRQINIIPAEAREVIYHEARAQAIADLMRDGLLTNQAKAIEAVYHTTRTAASRSESVYQKAKRRIDELTSVRPAFYDDMRRAIEAEPHQAIRVSADLLDRRQDT